MRQKLTPAFVTKVAPGDTGQVYWDTEQRGFGPEEKQSSA
jgi:hypothetical protein